MRFWILLILLGFPFAEAWLLVKLGEGHGMWVVGWVVLAALAGMALIKEARFAMVARLGALLANGQFSLAPIIDSGRSVIAGFLLIFPGVLSDLLALLVLLWPVRQPAYERTSGPRVIDGAYRREN